MNCPLVSVIIPCYNGAQYLEEAVESVLAQTYSNLECLIVDDGSTDNTRQVGEALMSRDSRVRYFFKENEGVASARNFGVEHARGEWIQFLDADDWLHQDKIRFQLSYANDFRPDEDVVFYSNYEYVYLDNDQNVVKKITNITGCLTSEQLIERIATWSFTPDFPVPIWTLLIKKSVCRKKTLNENLDAFEDLEFILDILLKGVLFVYTPIIGTFYRQHGFQTVKKQSLMRENYIRYLELVYEKDERLLYLCPNMGRLIKESIVEEDKKSFDILINLIRRSQTPVFFTSKKIQVNNLFLIKLLYFLRSILPLPSFIFYLMLYPREREKFIERNKTKLWRKGQFYRSQKVT